MATLKDIVRDSFSFGEKIRFRSDDKSNNAMEEVEHKEEVVAVEEAPVEEAPVEEAK